MYKNSVVFQNVLCLSLVVWSAAQSSSQEPFDRHALGRKLSSSRIFKSEKIEEALSNELEIIKNYTEALKSATLQQLLFEAVTFNAHSAIGTLITAGAHPDKPLPKETDELQSAPLHLAVFENRILVINQLLRYKARIHVTDAQGETPLHVAVERERTELIPALIKEGALNARNISGVTPLLKAVHKESLDSIQELLKAGANQWEQSNAYGSTPFNIAEAKALTKEASEAKRSRNLAIYHAFIGAQLRECITKGNSAELRTLTEKYQCRPPLLFAHALMNLEKQREEKKDDTYQEELLEDMKTILETHLSKTHS